MGAATNWVARVMLVSGQLVLAFMVVTIFYDALMRYLFAAPTSWSLEVNTFLIIYVATMTAAAVQQTDSHIRITFFTDLAGPTFRRAVRVIIGVVGVAFCAVMTWRGFLMAYQAFEYGERVSSSFGTPMVLPYALLPLGFGMLAIRFAMDAILALFYPEALPTEPGENLEEI